MYYVALDIGCIECGEGSAILGIFDSQEKAQSICDKYAKLQEKHWRGQHAFEVHEVKNLNEEIPVSY